MFSVSKREMAESTWLLMLLMAALVMDEKAPMTAPDAVNPLPKPPAVLCPSLLPLLLAVAEDAPSAASTFAESPSKVGTMSSDALPMLPDIR